MNEPHHTPHTHTHTHARTHAHTRCSRHRWVLAWTLGERQCDDRRRLLDPVVLGRTTVNVTVSSAVSASIKSTWTQAASAWAQQGANPLNASQWAALVDKTQTPGVADVLLWNIGARECADYDNCLGLTHSNGDCACYGGANNAANAATATATATATANHV